MMINERPVPPALGMSGSLVGITTMVAILKPKITFSVGGIIPVPAWFCAIGFIGYDLFYGAGYGGSSKTAHWGHLGGAAFALLYYVVSIRRRLRPSRPNLMVGQLRKHPPPPSSAR
ncbi:RHOMBOID-like protein 12, mitochondrial [Neolecta irregularis DAH-3]|uniref:RHOMBOID-like protein 12, mitochondrial n=1 Tax=Neolecta irregularis (strain DAH-3) TaxID=1198029 RepID=A0A1U7LI73_NEOID|nr:RHOMBOID-like protein 12, mitochondrial [Neolecta irregularis DAH-3]|eukprot:OLL22328.1 RHOMBOID-like protein 12, mitochondrial [Neolecta irregularis DAH-3]